MRFETNRNEINFCFFVCKAKEKYKTSTFCFLPFLYKQRDFEKAQSK